jgi:uracil-DNA glycosylase family 4
MLQKDKFVTAASVKCPSVGEADMSPKNMNLCRVHLDATIDRIRPKLIFACGNLALKMLLKKSGITNKRGKAFTFATESGFTCVVVPIYHPYSCIKRFPRHLALFKTGYSERIREVYLR